jgi:alkanesulfonate monooxygenase SsuD/methylene tetrahydromethanopterin reductase-like flavin-dependent oxidoreductase (luciferase family)
MHVAMFQTPLQPPERSPRQVFDWAVEQAIAADQAGFTEYWVGEHATLNWESIPNPELVIAASVRETESIKFAPGAHLPPYYHPASLAVQVAWLSRVLEGRYMLGVGAGAYPSDAALRGMTDLSKNHEMLFEALDIMQMIWSAHEPFHFEGNFWSAGYPDAEVVKSAEKGEAAAHGAWRDLSPYEGKIEIGMTGLSERSPSIRMAGERGFVPMSVFAGNEFMRNHWRDYEAAASAAGRTVDRSIHHVLRDVFVGETDKQARKDAVEGGLGRAWREYLLPTYKRFGILKGMLHDPSIDMDDVDLDYLAEHIWISGSVDTVVEKLNTWQEEVGGFGTLAIYSHDYSANPQPWLQSMNLLSQEVVPRVKSPVSAVTA